MRLYDALLYYMHPSVPDLHTNLLGAAGELEP